MRSIAVAVEAYCHPDGTIEPKTIIWKDGRRFDIDSIIYFVKYDSGDSVSIKYAVIIKNKEKQLYWFNNRWYIGNPLRR